MKVEVINGEVYRDDGKYAVGKTFETDDKEAERLIGLGAVRKAGGKGAENASAGNSETGGKK